MIQVIHIARGKVSLCEILPNGDERVLMQWDIIEGSPHSWSERMAEQFGVRETDKPYRVYRLAEHPDDAGFEDFEGTLEESRKYAKEQAPQEAKDFRGFTIFRFVEEVKIDAVED